jgi:RNA polymerase sigma-70 factor (ECF subfamily)
MMRLDMKDETLIEECRNGNRQAFGELVTKYQSLVYGLCYSMVGNFADAQDLSQEIFLKAFVNLYQLREPSKFGQWLNRLANNMCKMWLRKNRQRFVPIESLNQEQLISQQNDMREHEMESMHDSLQKAINSLSHKNRLAFVLYYMNGKTCKEVSEFLGVSVDVIKSRLSQARKLMRKELITMAQEKLEGEKLPEDFKGKILKITDDWVAKYTSEEFVLGLAAVGEVADENFWEGTTIHLFYLSEGEKFVIGPDRGTFVTPLRASVEQLERMTKSVENFCDTFTGVDGELGIFIPDLLYECQIYYDPQKLLAKYKKHVRGMRLSPDVTELLAQKRLDEAKKLIGKHEQAIAVEDYASAIWHLQCASVETAKGILERNKVIVPFATFRAFPNFLRQRADELKIQDVYQKFVHINRLGKDRKYAEDLIYEVELLMRTEFFDMTKLTRELREEPPKTVIPNVSQNSVKQAMSIGGGWTETFFLFKFIFQPVIEIDRYDDAVFSMRDWLIRGMAFMMPFLFESLLTGEDITHDRPDFMKAMKSFKHPDSSIYDRLLKIYDLEDANEERAIETHRMVEEMMKYLQVS